MRLAPHCEWVTYRVPYTSRVEALRIFTPNAHDDPDALEAKLIAGGNGGFKYHCKKGTGSAVITFAVAHGQDKKLYKLRIGCMAE